MSEVPLQGCGAWRAARSWAQPYDRREARERGGRGRDRARGQAPLALRPTRPYTPLHGLTGYRGVCDQEQGVIEWRAACSRVPKLSTLNQRPSLGLHSPFARVG